MPHRSVLRFALACVAPLMWTPPAARAQSPASPMWFDLEAGSHAVGFTTRWVMDSSRAYGPSAARPIRIFVWFPAVAGTGAPMRYGDYLRIHPEEGAFAEYGAARSDADRGTARRQFSPPSDSLLAIVEALAVAARLDARPAPGPFPLVIHALGLGDYQLESTVLWEYLASHGQVVAVVPQVGIAPGERLGFDEASMHTQVQDIAFARTAMAAASWVDDDHLGILGHSYGGLAALLYADRASDVDAVVALDGSAVTEDGIALIREAGWTFSSARASVLNLFRATAPPRDLSVFDLLARVDRYHVVLGDTAAPRRATHYDFQNWPLFSELVGVPDPRAESWRPPATGVGFYLAVCRLTRTFLDDIFRGGSDAILALRSGTAPPGIPARLVVPHYDGAAR